MRTLFVLMITAFSHFIYGQGDQTIITVPAAGSTTQKAILHLPDDYQTTAATYPLIVFLHGAGEAGTNPATIYNSSTAGGPSYFIANGKWPSSVTNPADGKAYKFIVVSPQSVPANSSTSAGSLDKILSYLVKTYRVDASRIYLTGLSMGGASLFQYVNNEGVTATFTPAATIPMSMAIGTPNNTEVSTHLKKNVNVWGFGSESDIYGIQTHLFIVGSYGGNNGPTPPALGKNGRNTSYAGGHCCWGTYYSPTYRETINGNAMNIYEWALQFQQGVSTPPVVTPPVVIPPVVVPPAPKTIKSITILYSDGSTTQITGN